MPTYHFRNTRTNVEYEEMMSMAERETYLKENPHIVQLLTTLTLGDPVRLGITKPPADFMKGIVGRMQEAIPGNRLKDSGKFQVPREI